MLHLVGSAESALLADVSLLYARGCLDALQGSAVPGALPVLPGAGPDAYEHVVAHVSPDGRWRFPHALDAAAIAQAPSCTLAEAVRRITALAPDVAVPQMFCRPGMTRYRALLELLGVPMLGNRAEVMALGADKALARAVVAAGGVRVPAGTVVRPGEPVTLDGRAPEGAVVVKPVDADNSLGVTLVPDAAAPGALEAAVAEACRHSARALVETYVELGREVRCGVVDVEGELVCLPLEEYAVDPVGKPVRDHADKLRRDDAGDLGLVAKDAEHAWIVDPSDPVVPAVHAAARAAYDALGCRHYGLFDFRVDPEGRPWFLEASLYCSYAPSSVLVVMAEAAGLPLARLFRLAVDDALAALPASPTVPPARTAAPPSLPLSPER